MQDIEFQIEPKWEISLTKINNGYLLEWYEPLLDSDAYRLNSEYCSSIIDAMYIIADHFAEYSIVIEPSERGE